MDGKPVSASFPYQRLPGVRRGLVRKASLWEGADHLFAVKGTRFAEQYRRFYYRDIQALVILKSAQAGSIGIWLLTIFFCASFILFAANLPHTVSAAYRLGAWLPSAVLFLYLVYRLIISLGYSCRCYIQTAVTWEELPSLYRIWNARKTLDRIRGRITELQGAIAGDPQVLAEQVGSASPSFQPMPVVSGNIEEAEGNSAVATGINLALFGCVALLAIAAFLFWYMDAPARYAARSGVIAANAVLSSMAGVVVSLALFRLYKIRTLRALRNFLFAALGLIGLHLYFSTAVSGLYSPNNPISAELSSPRLRHWFGLIDGSFSLLLGITGTALLVSKRQEHHRRPASNS